MTSKLVVNTIEADTGISSVSFASSISMSSTSKFHFGDAGIDIGADTNINRPASGVLGFNINSSEKARIDSSGRVLIGTTTEGASGADQFTVASSSHGGITIRSGSTSNGNFMFSDGTSGAAEYAGYVQYEHDNNKLNIGVNGSTKLSIDSTGRISSGKHGVGTYNDASEWFKVQSNDSAANISIVGSNDTHSSLNLGDEDDFNIQKIKSDHTNNSLQFFTDNTERFRITSTGRLKIGSSTATGEACQLTLTHTNNSGVGLIDIDSYGSATLQIRSNWSGGTINGMPNQTFGFGTPHAYPLVFTTSGTERLRINSSGTITTPYQFHIEVRRSGNQTGYDARSSAGGTPVVFNDVVRTRGTANSALNTSTGKITVPVDGVYFLEASAYTTSGNVLSQGWFTEGSLRMTYSDITQHTSTDQIQAHGMHYLSANTEVGFHPYGATASSITIEANIYHTWFRVTLIG